MRFTISRVEPSGEDVRVTCTAIDGFTGRALTVAVRARGSDDPLERVRGALRVAIASERAAGEWAALIGREVILADAPAVVLERRGDLLTGRAPAGTRVRVRVRKDGRKDGREYVTTTGTAGDGGVSCAVAATVAILGYQVVSSDGVAGPEIPMGSVNTG